MQPDEGRVQQTAQQVQSTVVDGHSNTVYSIGRLFQEQHVHHRQHAPGVGQGQFFPIALEDYGSKQWVDPPRAEELVRLLEEHHLLILAGGLTDKKDCAEHLVHQLCGRLQERNAGKLQILEKCSGRDPQKIETALDDEEPRVLILPDVSPRQLIGQTPATLRSLLRGHQSYAILTTENNLEDWDILPGSLEAELWRELSWETYYGVPLLRDFLRQRLIDSKKEVPEHLLPDSEGLLLIEGLDMSRAVVTLRTPGKVRFFCDWLLSVKEPLTREQIEEQLARLGDDDESVAQWYRQFNPRYQLLVLGLILFDGLPDEIIFTGLELLVKNIWRSSDPSIPQFDYGDLVLCSAYFKKVESKRGPTRIRSTSQERRHCLLKLAWNHQRRRLLLALPVLREMIRISATTGPSESQGTSPAAATNIQPATAADGQGEAAGHALSRSSEDTLQLHQALVDSLGLISQLSPQVVERHFLELAADASESVQRLAARALSTWRDNGHEKDLFELLLGWWKEACEPWNVDSRIARLGDRGDDAFAAVRAAVALTVGYAARFDRENQLTSELYELLVRALEDRNPRVKKASSQALQLAVAWHFRQLEPLLRMRVLHSNDFLADVALGAAEACSLRTEETVAILDTWRAIARAEKRRSSPDRVSPRERLLATVALTYGEIRADRGEWPLSPELLCANLRSILMEELHPFVRSSAFAAIEKQALQNFDMVVRLLQDLLSQIQLQDRPAVVEIFTKTYLHQRHRLTDGDQKIEVDGRYYNVWMDSLRPLTEIEATLYGWLLDSSHPIVQQLAVDVFDRLGKTSLEIAERRFRATRPLVPTSPVHPEGADRRPQPQVRPLPLLGQAAVFCVAPRKPPVRATLQPLLAEVIALQRIPVPRPAGPQPPQIEIPRSPVATLLERWGGVTNDATKAVADLLGRAFALYRWRWAILSFALLLAFAVYQGAPFVYHQVQESRAATAPVPVSTQGPSNP
jgi:hypothetical protein